MADPRLTKQADNLIQDIHIYRSAAGHFVCNVLLHDKTDPSEDAAFETYLFAHNLELTTKLPDELEGRRRFLGGITAQANLAVPSSAYFISSTQPCNNEEEVAKFAANALFSLAERTGLPPAELLERVNLRHNPEKEPEYLSKHIIAPYLEALGKQRMH